MDKLLDYVYYELHNYVGANSLYQIAKEYNKDLKLKDVKEWLKKQETHQQTTAKDIGLKKYYKPIYIEIICNITKRNIYFDHVGTDR